MEEKAQDVVKLAQEDIVKLKARVDAFEAENNTLRGVVNTMKQEKDELAKDVQAYRKQAHQAGIEKFCAKLERDYNVTPACLEIITPVLSAENGVVKLAEGEKPEREAALDAIVGVVALAQKNALFVPTGAKLPTGKQQEEVLTDEQRREKAIQKFMADSKLTYDAALLKAAQDPESKDLFDPLKRYQRGGK